jgi:uncharacterized protein (TIGR00730 family)
MSRSICVYCSSSDQVDRAHFAVAEQLGSAIGQHGDTLVWGGGRVGLMGQVARSAHAHGGKVVGVIPESMTNVEIAYHEADELIVTQTMRQRKAIMDQKSDAFVILPGGFGTLEELAEMITLKLLKYHDRPIVIINVDNFYDPLIELFEHFIEHQFAKPKHRQLYHVVTEVAEVFKALEPPEKPKTP